MSDYSRFFFADVGNWFSVMFRLRGSGLQLGPSRQPNSVPRSGQFEDRCLWKRSRRCRGSLFLNTFRELFCAVSRGVFRRQSKNSLKTEPALDLVGCKKTLKCTAMHLDATQLPGVHPSLRDSCML